MNSNLSIKILPVHFLNNQSHPIFPTLPYTLSQTESLLNLFIHLS